MHAAAARVVAAVDGIGADDGPAGDDVVALRVAGVRARDGAVVHVVALEAAVVVAHAAAIRLVVARLVAARAFTRQVAVVAVVTFAGLAWAARAAAVAARKAEQRGEAQPEEVARLSLIHI